MCRPEPSTPALSFVVVISVPLEPTEEIENLALLEAADVLGKRAVYRFPLRTVISEALCLKHETIVECEIRGHDESITQSVTQCTGFSTARPSQPRLAGFLPAARSRDRRC